MNIYIAGPLFTLAERRVNDLLMDATIDHIAHLECFEPSSWLPQEQCLALDPKGIGRVCLAALDNADIVVAILDGPDPDSGTCIEMGYAYAKGKKIIGVRT